MTKTDRVGARLARSAAAPCVTLPLAVRRCRQVDRVRGRRRLALRPRRLLPRHEGRCFQNFHYELLKRLLDACLGLGAALDKKRVEAPREGHAFLPAHCPAILLVDLVANDHGGDVLGGGVRVQLREPHLKIVKALAARHVIYCARVSAERQEGGMGVPRMTPCAPR